MMQKNNSRQGQRTGHRGGGGRRPRTQERDRRDDLKERVLDLRRVTRVVAGGKRFRFRATVVVGDERGKVGIGVGKGVDVAQAVGKARNDAKKNMIILELSGGRTLLHEVSAKYSAASVILKPAKTGHGLKAGGAARVVLALAGVKDATAKCISRTPNKLTNALATMTALKKIKKSSMRGK